MDIVKKMWAAYCEAADGVTYDGKPLPTWEELGEGRQKCWVAAGKEAADEIKRLLAERDEWKQAAGAEASERRRSHEEIGLLREGLNSIANNSCCGTCQEAALVAKRTLEGK